MEETERPGGLFAILRQLFTLKRDVLVLSIAMFAFSLSFQMTTRFLPEYLVALGASGLVVGIFGSLGNMISAIYPYPGGAISDRIGSRYALTLFGALSTFGFLIWVLAPVIGDRSLGPIVIPAWAWIVIGLLLAQAWKSFGLGATFAIVKQTTAPGRLAAGFASTETFRRTAFLLGPIIAAVLIELHPAFTVSFRYVLAVAVVFGAVGTVVQHVLYDASEDTIGDTFRGLTQIRSDLRQMPAPLRPLLIGDTLVRFANGMIYVFVVLIVTQVLQVGVETTLAIGELSYTVDLSPQALFGFLLGVEMLVALLVMAPAAYLAESVGLKPVVAIGFAVYALFPAVLIMAPASAVVLVVVFAFSGLRFAGLPAHKALIVGPAQQDAGGRITGSYYLLRNTIVIPSAAVGGLLWETLGPESAFSIAAVIGGIGTVYFLRYGKEYAAYA